MGSTRGKLKQFPSCSRGGDPSGPLPTCSRRAPLSRYECFMISLFNFSARQLSPCRFASVHHAENNVTFKATAARWGCIFFTTGTSGEPPGVQRSHGGPICKKKKSNACGKTS